MDKPVIFTAQNKHVSDSGKPPQIDANTPNRYHAYFENAQGEQLIFIYDRESDTGTLYHGDLGWEQPRPVEDGKCPSVLLDEADMLWLRSCWMAATAFRKHTH